ncbi:hypothetical protein BDA96_04G303000 [Sorghum bicolor]|uniref:Uncharacterized protein n=2 Tax=Sorghum bicolor TaxID=4558 RepID=A0A921R7I2_SORBI|nr:hypothetical protein BDA96_04G303000 [Sorghum bicolor]KXG31019.1 hypothetical protein SORBI_3004G284300 [Sorghum bicolor]
MEKNSSPTQSVTPPVLFLDPSRNNAGPLSLFSFPLSLCRQGDGSFTSILPSPTARVARAVHRRCPPGRSLPKRAAAPSLPHASGGDDDLGMQRPYGGCPRPRPWSDATRPRRCHTARLPLGAASAPASRMLGETLAALLRRP